ncbi:MAG: helix-turn-helix transcriptional regulator, partial [Bacteroidetes bacterium]|nr:helix-turn-helix transcriptional regulator [Bacteroidota bacterium]
GQIQAALVRLMQHEKVYLDETLTLNKLSEQLEILPNYLSQVINERFDKNFYDFVNSYRIEEFKILVQRADNRNKTLLALALDSGFTSKTSFNNFFKKLTGKTPTEYIKSIKN